MEFVPIDLSASSDSGTDSPDDLPLPFFVTGIDESAFEKLRILRMRMRHGHEGPVLRSTAMMENCTPSPPAPLAAPNSFRRAESWSDRPRESGACSRSHMERTQAMLSKDEQAKVGRILSAAFAAHSEGRCDEHHSCGARSASRDDLRRFQKICRTNKNFEKIAREVVQCFLQV